MFTPGIMSAFYLILFPAGFSEIHPGHNKTWEKSVQPRKVILFGIPLMQQGSNNLQNVVKLYNHFLFAVKTFYTVMVLICSL